MGAHEFAHHPPASVEIFWAICTICERKQKFLRKVKHLEDYSCTAKTGFLKRCGGRLRWL